MSGDVTAQRIGDVRVRTMSGDVKLSGIAKADVQTISGDARIDDATGPVRLQTVSGHAVISTSGTSPQVEFHSASGSLDWAGTFGRDCHLSAETGPISAQRRSGACSSSATLHSGGFATK
jgi:DUF4097 and DUF4098 domain-containing protein YvlB